MCGGRGGGRSQPRTMLGEWCWCSVGWLHYLPIYVCVCVYLCVLGRQYLPIYVCMCVYVDCVSSGKLQC